MANILLSVVLGLVDGGETEAGWDLVPLKTRVLVFWSPPHCCSRAQHPLQTLPWPHCVGYVAMAVAGF